MKGFSGGFWGIKINKTCPGEGIRSCFKICQTVIR